MHAAAALPPHATRRALLDRFRPLVRYDSREGFYADSVEEMLRDPAVQLRRESGAVIAVPGSGPEALSGAFFTSAGYGNGQPYEHGDHIAFTRHDYRAQARELRRQPGVADVVYGHFAYSPSLGTWWLQYWYFMLYNDAQLVGRFGLHEGDWEMVQLELSGSDWERPAISRAVYAQHRAAEQREWPLVEKADQEVPIAYSALGSHAHYFEAGVFRTELWDVADGKGHAARQRLVYLDEEPPGWLSWPGTWGGTVPSLPAIEGSSPVGPARHGQWSDPGWLLARVRPAPALAGSAAARVTVRRALRNHPRVDFDFVQVDDPALFPGSLAAEVAPVDGSSPAATITIGLDAVLAGSLTLRHSLDPSREYFVGVTWLSATGQRTPLATARLARLPMTLPPLWVRWLLYALRWLLTRITHPTR